MDRTCPKRRKTKGLLSDCDIRRYLNKHETEVSQKKVIQLTKVPEDWATGLVLSLYHEGFTVALDAQTKQATDIITYDECDFFRYLEEGEIPDILLPLLPELTLVSENKLVVEIYDYRGYPRDDSSSTGYLLDHPISTRHVLSKSVQSLVLEMYSSLGEQLSISQLQQIENYLLMANCPPLCLDTSTEVFHINNNIHLNKNMLNNQHIRTLIHTATSTSNAASGAADSTLSDSVEELCHILSLNRSDKRPPDTSETTIDALFKTPTGEFQKPPTGAPNMVNEILELCTKRMRQVRVQLPTGIPVGVRQVSNPRSVETEQVPQPQVSPAAGGYVPTPGPPQLKPAPFMTNNKNIIPAPKSISPKIQHGPMTPTNTGPSSMGPSPMGPSPLGPSPLGNVNRVASEQMNITKGVRGPYNTGYIVSPQPLSKPQSTAVGGGTGMRVTAPVSSTMMGQQPPGIGQQAPSLGQQPPSLMRTSNNSSPGQMMPGTMPQHMTQHNTLPNTQPHIKSNPPDTMMTKPGMIMPQQYQRNYQYHNVPNMSSRGGYGDQNQYIPVQGVRPNQQVLQIPLPPNMNPHQPSVRPIQPRQQPVAMSAMNTPSANIQANIQTNMQTNIQPLPNQQQPLHRVPYNQMTMSTLQPQNPNMYNQYG